MAKKTDYNKLVRDKIPDIIRADGGKVAATRLMKNRDELLVRLCDKLNEETEELRKANTPDEKTAELADLLEVLKAYMKAVGILPSSVESVRRKKRHERNKTNGHSI